MAVGLLLAGCGDGATSGRVGSSDEPSFSVPDDSSSGIGADDSPEYDDSVDATMDDSSSDDYDSSTYDDSDDGLGNDDYYVNSNGNVVHSPAYDEDGDVPAGATAECRDGTYSFSQHRSGTCSYDGGVDHWL